MPISEKIKKHISLLKIKPAEKQLMLEILEVEDQGIFRYKQEYDKCVKAYLGEKKRK